MIPTWRHMIEMRAVDIIQPDICYLGGLTRTLRVAAMGAEAGLPWDGYQVVAEGVSEPGAAGDATAREWVDAGATYWVESDWSMGADAVDRHRRRIEAGPPRP